MSKRIRCDGCGNWLERRPGVEANRDRGIGGPNVPPEEFDWCVACSRIAFDAVAAANQQRRRPAVLPVALPGPEETAVIPAQRGLLNRLGRRPQLDDQTVVLPGGVTKVPEWVPQQLDRGGRGTRWRA